MELGRIVEESFFGDPERGWGRLLTSVEGSFFGAVLPRGFDKAILTGGGIPSPPLVLSHFLALRSFFVLYVISMELGRVVDGSPGSGDNILSSYT